jgi:plasmid rolling circle replication initiator protein Rep
MSQTQRHSLVQKNGVQVAPSEAHHHHDKDSTAPNTGHCKNEHQKRVFVAEHKHIYKIASSGTEQTKNPLLSRAKAKDFSYNLAQALMCVPNTPLYKSYQNTTLCASQLFRDGDKETSHYCGNRWCLVCNRIRCAKLINAYEPQIRELLKPVFVTLTVPNVQGRFLRNTIREMKRNFSKICSKHKKRHQRKTQDFKMDGLLKIECTYNRNSNTFHPHFHVVLEGEQAAKALVRDWLKIYPYASKKGQDSRPAKVGTSKEMFKYYAKMITPMDNGWGVYVVAMDTIFCAMRGMNTFSNFGELKPVSEGVREIQSIINDDYSYGCSEYDPIYRDWVDTETGELRTGYKRNKTLNEIIGNFII